MLRWARERGCPWDELTCALAASRGHLQVLQWAREHGWDNINVCAGAAVGGHLEVLQWARAHGCPWNEMTCDCAAAHGHLELLKWAQEHGCEWDPNRAFQRAHDGGHLEVIQWIRPFVVAPDQSVLEVDTNGV